LPAPKFVVAGDTEMVTAGGTKLTAAVADLVGSARLVALTVTVCAAEI
jgi:hypothetical protein